VAWRACLTFVLISDSSCGAINDCILALVCPAVKSFVNTGLRWSGIYHGLYLFSLFQLTRDFQLRTAKLRSLETKKGNLVRHVGSFIVGVLYLNSVADHEIVERALRFVLYDNLRVCWDRKLLLDG
jgi:hypothetical protein